MRPPFCDMGQSQEISIVVQTIQLKMPGLVSSIKCFPTLTVNQPFDWMAEPLRQVFWASGLYYST